MRGMRNAAMRGTGRGTTRPMGSGAQGTDQKLKAPVRAVVTSSRKIVVPKGARWVTIETLQAGQNGHPRGQVRYGGKGGDYAIETVKVRGKEVLEAIVGASNGQHSEVLRDGSVLCTSATPTILGGAGGVPFTSNTAGDEQEASGGRSSSARGGQGGRNASANFRGFAGCGGGAGAGPFGGGGGGGGSAYDRQDGAARSGDGGASASGFRGGSGVTGPTTIGSTGAGGGGDAGIGSNGVTVPSVNTDTSSFPLTGGDGGIGRSDTETALSSPPAKGGERCSYGGSGGGGGTHGGGGGAGQHYPPEEGVSYPGYGARGEIRLTFT